MGFRQSKKFILSRHKPERFIPPTCGAGTGQRDCRPEFNSGATAFKPWGSIQDGMNVGDSKERGFTFLELMVTVVILSVGIIMIYQGFLTSLYYQKHLIYRAYAMNLLEHKMSYTQYLLKQGKEIPAYEEGEIENIVLNNQNVMFHFQAGCRPLTALPHIYNVDMKLSWKERGRVFRIGRTAYISGL